MEKTAAAQYCALMEEVKLRTRVADAFINGGATAVYRATNIESIYLQFRKILELIAFGSLLAHKEAFSKVYAEFSRFWNARRLIEDLERVNPGFYPQPIIEKFDEKRNMRAWLNKTEGFLTRDDFVALYKECGGILHERNPFADKIDYARYDVNAANWFQKIIGLLDTHTIQLLDDSNLYLVHMNEKQDGHVHHYVFAKTDPPPGLD